MELEMPSTRLTAQDAAFIYGEDQRIPLHVGCVGFIEAGPLRDDAGAVDIDRIREGIERRLHLVPVFRQRLAQVPFDQGRPFWVDDPRFRIEDHVHLSALPRPGTRRQLMALMGRLQSKLLDRNRPLWEIYFVDGLEGGREVAMISKVHHAMIDGTSGVELATLIFDLKREGTGIQPPSWVPDPEPSRAGLLFDALHDRASDAVRRAAKVARAVRNPAKPVDHLLKFARAVGTMTGDLDPLPFNARVGSRRAFETATLPMEQVLETRRALGVTVNDVALTAVAGAVRRYCNAAGIDPETLRAVRALVPVNNRAPDDKRLGSNVSSLFVDLPVDEPDTRRRAERIAGRSRELKSLDVAEGANMWARVTSVIPPTLLRAASWFQFRGLMAQANLMVSNVRGPAAPVYSFGAEVREFFPYFGVQDGLGLNIVLVSYNGKLLIGVAADPDLVPELGVFVEALRKAFGELAAIV
jgi:WS/DGAT/MGAT family acyltransferase